MHSRKLIVLFLAMIGAVAACSSSQKSNNDEISKTEQAIINGTQVTGRDYLSTVSLLTYYQSTCTATLIDPQWVLTAAHCISNCNNNTENLRNQMLIGIGQSEDEILSTFTIDKFYPHPEFVCEDSYIANDIALIKLKEAVPLSLAVPVLPLPPALAMTESEIASGIHATSVGFGKTDPDDDSSGGVKYKTNYDVSFICNEQNSQTDECRKLQSGFMYFDDPDTSLCSGDSGGPVFINKDGRTYVAGVASFVTQNCKGMSAATVVSEHYDFIKTYVPVAAETDENCGNNTDDNGDNRIDCDDPLCFTSQKSCIPEDCTNGVDDDGNGKTDCEEAICAQLPKCIPENCTNKIDDNGDGLIDCEDPQCYDALVCQPENCYNNIDDNGNGKIDCEDPDCSKVPRCMKENCTNGKDDNEDGLIDCLDPQCTNASECQPENCSNGKDDNNNGLIDCADPQCSDAIACQPENCINKVDDNNNGLIDCDDPQCKTAAVCQKEICNDNKDNNNDGLIDCNDPECFYACNISVNDSSSCSFNAQKPNTYWPILMLIPLITMVVRRKRNEK